MSPSNCLGIVLSFLLVSLGSAAQKPAPDTSGYKIVIADSNFLKRSSAYQQHWGTNRRSEWATTVKVPLLWLDKSYGGLIPYEKGGGNESRTLHLHNKAGKEYTLRSINKSRDDVIPQGFDKTFAEDIIRDQVSSSNPYGSFALVKMQEEAGLYHTEPILVYLPKQDALDSFNVRFGNGLYLFEQRPDGDWSESVNLGNFKAFNSTEKVVQKMLDDNSNRTDQFAFAKARVFDMLIGDWDRHEGNWRWGVKEQGDKKIFFPVARDRDQAFYTHNGKLLDRLLAAGGFGYMQSFDEKMGDPVAFNSPEKDFDRFFTNQLDQMDWVTAANQLQQALTDTVIAASVHQLPPEVFAVCGNELIEKLKARRNQLVDIVGAYYVSLAKLVQVTGSKQKEYVDVSSNADGYITVSISGYDEHTGQKEGKPFYKRVFNPNHTSEIRIFGIGGDDIYKIDIHSVPVTVRIIGGPGKDSVVQTGDRIHIYDNKDNSFQTSTAKLHLSSASSIHDFAYQHYHTNSSGISPDISYNYGDRFYVGIDYTLKRHQFRREPFASKHVIGLNYSFTQHAISTFYSGFFPKLIGKWDPFINIDFDAVRWTHFYGLGNETKSVNNIGNYRMISRDWMAAAGLRRTFGKGTLEIAGFFQRLKIKIDTNSFAAKTFPSTYKDETSPNNYGGASVSYKYISVNDAVVPTKGFQFLVKGIYNNNFTQEEFFQHYILKMEGFLPLSKKFSLNIRMGGATIIGSSNLLNTARVYQHAVIGGPETLRGYRWERFWGKSAFYNNNELRFITDIRTHYLNTKFGLLAFFDDGRVWMPGEESDTFHSSYGGGILLAPFKLVSFTMTYGITNEEDLFQFKINKLF